MQAAPALGDFFQENTANAVWDQKDPVRMIRRVGIELVPALQCAHSPTAGVDAALTPGVHTAFFQLTLKQRFSRLQRAEPISVFQLKTRRDWTRDRLAGRSM